MTKPSQPTYLANPTSEKAGPNNLHDPCRSKLRECVASGHFRPHGRFHRPQHQPPRDGQHHGRDGPRSYDPFGCQWVSTPCTEAQRANPRASARKRSSNLEELSRRNALGNRPFGGLQLTRRQPPPNNAVGEKTTFGTETNQRPDSPYVGSSIRSHHHELLSVSPVNSMFTGSGTLS